MQYTFYGEDLHNLERKQALQRNVVQNATLYLWSILHFCKVIIFNTLLDVLTINADYHFWCQFFRNQGTKVSSRDL